MNKSLNETNTILILSIVLTIIAGIFNNASAIFHEQELNNEKISDTSREFIIKLFDNVNNVSNEFYQYEPGKEEESIQKNITIVNKTNDYIGKLEKIISLAKEYNIQEEYKPILNNYINSLKNEIESHKHYKNYILTGNITENKLSENLLSKALSFEMEAIKEFKKLE